jgi:hypothetical protein
MRRSKNFLIIGISLIIVGIGIVYFNLGFIKGSFNKLWPVSLLLIGLTLYILYFSTLRKKNRPIFLFLATFFTVSTVPLFVLTMTTYEYIVFVWPGFLFAIGMGILFVYFYGKRNKFSLFISLFLIAGSILIWVIYSITSKFGLVIGISFLVVGAAFLIRGVLKEKSPQNAIPSQEGEELNLNNGREKSNKEE